MNKRELIEKLEQLSVDDNTQVCSTYYGYDDEELSAEPPEIEVYDENNYPFEVEKASRGKIKGTIIVIR